MLRSVAVPVSPLLLPALHRAGRAHPSVSNAATSSSKGPFSLTLREAHPAEPKHTRLQINILPDNRNISFCPGEWYCILKTKYPFFTFILEGTSTGSGTSGLIFKPISPESCRSSDSGFSRASPQSNPSPEYKIFQITASASGETTANLQLSQPA